MIAWSHVVCQRWWTGRGSGWFLPDIGLVAAHAGGGDPPEGLVGLAVPAAVETVPDGTARGRLDRAPISEQRKRMNVLTPNSPGATWAG